MSQLDEFVKKHYHSKGNCYLVISLNGELWKIDRSFSRFGATRYSAERWESERFLKLETIDPVELVNFLKQYE